MRINKNTSPDRMFRTIRIQRVVILALIAMLVASVFMGLTERAAKNAVRDEARSMLSHCETPEMDERFLKAWREENAERERRQADAGAH